MSSTLTGHVESYLQALAARDPARAPFAPGARFTENGQVLPIGDGLWGTADGLGRYRHSVVDDEAGQAGCVAVVLENGTPVILALRLKVRADRIAEAETIVARDNILFYRGGIENLESMGAPLPSWDEVLPPAERAGRQALIETANAYFSALERNDGSREAPLAPDCRRMDNGVWATQNPEYDEPGQPPFYALGPAQQLRLGYFVFVTAIRARRFPIIDTARGVVFALGFFDHAGTVHEAHLTDGRTVPIGVKRPFSWQIAELFKIRAGRIVQIEAMMNQSPYGMQPNWDA